MASPARYPRNPKDTEIGVAPRPADGGRAGTRGVTALSVEFVAKPEETERVESAIPLEVAGALRDVTGFAGCLLLVAEHEARLVTVVTLWKGADRARVCEQNVRWVKALLKRYVDRWLRVQMMNAQLPVIAEPAPGVFREELSTIMAGETVCVV